MTIDYEEIDPYIMDLIKLLNDNGFTTEWCCSGTIEDHIDNDDKEDFESEGGGYISFGPLAHYQVKKIEEACKKSYIEFSSPHDEKFTTYNLDTGKLTRTQYYIDSYGVYNHTPSLSAENRETIDNVTDEKIDEILKEQWQLFYHYMKEAIMRKGDYIEIL